MLHAFVIDVLLLRQDKKVDETAVIIHNLTQTTIGSVTNWESFLLEQCRHGANLYDLTRKFFLSALQYQRDIVKRMLIVLDEHNTAIALRQVEYYNAIENAIKEDTVGKTEIVADIANYLGVAMEEACTGRANMSRESWDSVKSGSSVGNLLNFCLKKTH